MSEFRQIAPAGYGTQPHTGAGVSQIQLYGIDEAGDTAWCELVRDVDRGELGALAADRLREWHAVEIWEGPVCLVRIRRSSPGEG